jgi:predicted nucleotidyltransferase component of viral defense system
MIRPAEIETLASQLEFRPETLEKVLRLLDVLEIVTTHPYLQSRLALKGGTALNLFFGKPPRLSVDIDFNYIGAVERQTMLEERPVIERAFGDIGNGLSYRVQTNPQAHAGQSWYFGYQNLRGTPDRIEVDISFTNRVPLSTPQHLRPWSPDGVARELVLVCSTEELVAGKLRALIDRVAARDVFDAGWVTSIVPEENAEMLKKLFVVFGGTLDRPLYEYPIERIDRLLQSEINSHLVPVVANSASIDRDSLLNRCREVLEPFLRFDDGEREFCDALNRGEYRPEILLSEWPDICEPLRNHPALRWKAENAQKYKR